MVHGDGVPVTRVGQSGTKSLDTISWQSLFAAGVGVRNVKHLTFTIFEDNKAVPRAGDDSNTMHDAWEIIAWSFEAMFEGRFPDKDHKGRAYTAIDDPAEFALKNTNLAGNMFFVLWSIKGDLGYFAKGLGLKHYGGTISANVAARK